MLYYLLQRTLLLQLLLARMCKHITLPTRTLHVIIPLFYIKTLLRKEDLVSKEMSQFHTYRLDVILFFICLVLV